MGATHAVTTSTTTPTQGRRGRPLRRWRALKAAGATSAVVCSAWALLLASSPSPQSAVAPAIDPRAGALLDPSASSIPALERRVRDYPEESETWAALGLAYLEEARRTFDPAHYATAEDAFDTSLSLREHDNWAALAGLGALANARHDFSTALDFGLRAASINSASSHVHGIVTDALTELGRYPEAADAAQAMIDLRPDVASYTRISYQRELRGDVDGAVAAMQEAERSAGGASERAFAAYFLGELERNRGHIEAADAHYRRALELDSSYVASFAGLARLAYAEGDVAEAERLYLEVISRSSSPEFVIELADLYIATERPELAARQHAVLTELQQLEEANGGNIDLELAVYRADHGVDLEVGLQGARTQWTRRQSIHAADALAWQLHANGQHVEALEYANRALVLGTRSALFHFHRAEIERALGQLDAARADYAEALAINPHFSMLHSERAASHLADLERHR